MDMAAVHGGEECINRTIRQRRGSAIASGSQRFLAFCPCRHIGYSDDVQHVINVRLCWWESAPCVGWLKPFGQGAKSGSLHAGVAGSWRSDSDTSRKQSMSSRSQSATRTTKQLIDKLATSWNPVRTAFCMWQKLSAEMWPQQGVQGSDSGVSEAMTALGL